MIAFIAWMAGIGLGLDVVGSIMKGAEISTMEEFKEYLDTAYERLNKKRFALEEKSIGTSEERAIWGAKRQFRQEELAFGQKMEAQLGGVAKGTAIELAKEEKATRKTETFKRIGEDTATRKEFLAQKKEAARLERLQLKAAKEGQIGQMKIGMAADIGSMVGTGASLAFGEGGFFSNLQTPAAQAGTTVAQIMPWQSVVSQPLASPMSAQTGYTSSRTGAQTGYTARQLWNY